jgi:tRNA (guanine37-N1)-methyltransferase
MKYTVLTLFPEIIDAYFNTSIMSKAIQRGIIQYQPVNIRDFAPDKHKTCDDAPYGGGAGMLMLPEVLGATLKAVGVRSKDEENINHGVSRSFTEEEKSALKLRETISCPARDGGSPWLNSSEKPPRTIYLTPSGRPFDQGLAKELAGERELILLCGRYEGIDQRVIDLYIDDEISVGDYVLSSGEVAALAIIDATYRLVDDVITPESLHEESFSGGLLEYPQYTRPEIYDTLKVPDVLLSGHHENIRKWRLEKRVEKTLHNRPELIRRGREMRLFNEEVNSLIDKMLVHGRMAENRGSAEGDTENERDQGN